MIANNIIPIIFLLIIVYGMFKGRKVYEWFLEGAKEGLMVCVKIFPALLAMMIAIRIFKDANLLNYLNNLLEPIVSLIGLPKDIVPLVLIKPLSGSGALGVYTELINTFGAVGIKKIRHTFWAALMADITAIIMAVLVVSMFFGL